MLRVAEIADLYGSGEIRLTVWQKLDHSECPGRLRGNGQEGARQTGFRHATIEHPQRTDGVHREFLLQIRPGQYQRPRTRTGGLPRKDASRWIGPINIHLTGCPHSCAQHYMGDIGLLGTKVKEGKPKKATTFSSVAVLVRTRPWAARCSAALASRNSNRPGETCSRGTYEIVNRTRLSSKVHPAVATSTASKHSSANQRKKSHGDRGLQAA